MEQKRYFGTIFFPDLPNKRIQGVWLVINNSIYIEGVPMTSYADEQWNIILGEFNGIDKITFVNCYTDGYSNGTGGAYKNIYVSYLIKDFHAYNESDLVFKRMVLTSPALTKWIIEKESIKPLDRNMKTFQIPEVEEIAKATIDNVTIIIDLDYCISYSEKELHVVKVCSIIIESNLPINIVILSELGRHLNKLILFLTNKNPVFKSSFLFQEESEGYELIKSNNFYDLKEDRFSRGIHIGYYDIKDSINDVINNWFEHKKLHPIIDLVLEKYFNTEMSPNGFFISICMAIEIFQNTFGKKTEEILDPLVSQNREKIIKKLEDEELRNWFNEKSKYWNNPTLKDRLLEFESDIKELINGVFEITSEEFISKIVKTRNEIVHRGNLKEYFTTYNELFLVAKILEFTLKLHIMKLMGINTRKPPYSLFQGAKAGIKSLV